MQTSGIFKKDGMVMTFQTGALVIGMLTALIFRLFADKYRSAEGMSTAGVPFYWRPRAHFTKTGWRYRTISLVSGLAAFVPIAAGDLYKVST
jgi:hypothetical protein